MICPYDGYELNQSCERCEKCNRPVEEIRKSIQERTFPKPENVRIASITALVVGIITLLRGLIALLFATVFGFALGLYANGSHGIVTFIGFLFGCAFLVIPVLDIFLFKNLKEMNPSGRKYGIILQIVTFAVNSAQIAYAKSFQPFAILQLLGRSSSWRFLLPARSKQLFRSYKNRLFSNPISASDIIQW
jgi:hypothetical protein